MNNNEPFLPVRVAFAKQHAKRSIVELLVNRGWVIASQLCRLLDVKRLPQKIRDNLPYSSVTGRRRYALEDIEKGIREGLIEEEYGKVLTTNIEYVKAKQRRLTYE